MFFVFIFSPPTEMRFRNLMPLRKKTFPPATGRAPQTGAACSAAGATPAAEARAMDSERNYRNWRLCSLFKPTKLLAALRLSLLEKHSFDVLPEKKVSSRFP